MEKSIFTKTQGLIISLLINLAMAASRHSDEWRSRTIYQVVTDRFFPTDYTPVDNPCPNLRHYCGGTFKGLEKKLGYIKEMGFDAIWISPIFENTEVFDGTHGYHGYWMTNLYKLNNHFGNEQDFKDLVSAAHQLDIWVMVDVVANHAGPIGQNYSKFSAPLNRYEHYHEYCDILDQDLTQNQWRAERCWLSGLADFNHENPFVRKTLIDWVGNWTKFYDVDGLRIDTVRHVPHSFWKEFAEESNVFQIGEVFDSRKEFVASYQQELEGI